MQRLLCTRCGDSIHPDTAARNAGLCIPCVRGNQLTIEQRRQRQREEREEAEARYSSPEFQYWRSLVDRVYKKPDGWEGLAAGERLYFLINVLSGEVHNGGFEQFFSNSSGSRYGETVAALAEVDAQPQLELLLAAKVALFGDAEVPVDRMQRFDRMPTSRDDHPDYEEVQAGLDGLDRTFRGGAEALSKVLTGLVVQYGLYFPKS